MTRVLASFCLSLGFLTLTGCAGDTFATLGGGQGGTAGTGSSGASGAATTIDQSCSLNGDCVLTSASCCGTCGAPTASDVIAVNTDSVSAQHELACADTSSSQCPLCATQINPDLLAHCAQGTCEVVDISTRPLTACESSEQCVVRAAACCECGATVTPGSLIALNAQRVAEYTALVCDPSLACAECAPVYPQNVSATCAEGHCKILQNLGG